MSAFTVHPKGEMKVASNKDHQPIRLIKGPPGFSPFVVQGALWQGTLRVSIRQHFSPKDRPDLLLPSKKGIDTVPALAKAIAEAIHEILEEMNASPDLDPLVEAGLELGGEEIPF